MQGPPHLVGTVHLLVHVLDPGDDGRLVCRFDVAPLPYRRRRWARQDGAASTSGAAVAVLALVTAVGASQLQWGRGRLASLLGWSPAWVERLGMIVAAVALVLGGRAVSRFPVPRPPRPSYYRATRWLVTGWGVVGLSLAPAITALIRLLPVSFRDPAAEDRSALEDLIDGVVEPALWEEFLWRVVVLGLLVQVVAPRTAVILQAVSFAVAHTSWSMAFGQVAHSAVGEFQFDLAAQAFLSGVIFGMLVVELGSAWPAVVAHALTNVDPALRGGPSWLHLTGTVVEFIVIAGTIAVSITVLGVRPAVRRVVADRLRGVV